MDEYFRIRTAIKTKRPDLIDDFDAQGFSHRIPAAMANWLDKHMPIEQGWHWQLVQYVADTITNLEKHQ